MDDPFGAVGRRSLRPRKALNYARDFDEADLDGDEEDTAYTETPMHHQPVSPDI
jgi:hypothetical protein